MKLKLFKTRVFKVSLSALFTVLCIYLITDLVDFSGFTESLVDLNYLFLLLAIFSLFVSYFFRVLRYEYILNLKKKRITILVVSTIHYFLNKILPARTGEISLPVLLKNHLNYSFKTGISTLVFFRLLDFFAMLVLFLISMFFTQSDKINMNLLILISILVLLIFIFSWIYLKQLIILAVSVFSKINIKKTERVKQKIIHVLKEVAEYKENKKPYFIVEVVIISIFNWAAIYFYYYFIILSFNFTQTYFQALFAATISNFTFILPINAIGNIGPFEGAWAAGFYLIDVGKDVSVPAGLFSNIFATLVTGLLALWGFIRLKLTKK